MKQTTMLAIINFVIFTIALTLLTIFHKFNLETGFDITLGITMFTMASFNISVIVTNMIITHINEW